MLKNTFQHIPGIGAVSERNLWNSGVVDWECLACGETYGLSPKKLKTIKDYAAESFEQLEQRAFKYFSDRMPAKEHWRFFYECRESVAYIDIETTGMDIYWDKITTIALYDGKKIRYYVRGENLEDFVKDIKEYDILVSYNGKTFDVPFLEGYFNIKLDHAHIDLRYVLKSLGYSGGLKKCEKDMGIDRGELYGVDGYVAILLWEEYQKTGDNRFLETLLAYNIEDVVNLEILMVAAHNMKIKDTPFAKSHQIAEPRPPVIPFQPDISIVDQMRDRMDRMPAPAWS